MTRAIIVGVAAALSVVSPAGAQSLYSLRGSGEATLPTRAATRAVGAAEAASATATLTGNPSNISGADKLLFYGTYVTEWVKTEEKTDAGVRVRKDYTGLISNVALIFPIGPIALGTGFLVDRRHGGTIEQPAVTDTTEAGQSYIQTFDASGNLLRVPALFAARLKRIEFGAGLDVLLRNSKRRWINDLSSTSDFVSSNDIARSSQWGVAWRGGLRLPVGRRLKIGAWFHLPSDLSGTLTFENHDPNGGKVENDIDSEVAPSGAVGLEVQPYYSLRILADWVHERWEDVTPLSDNTEFVNVDRIGGGIEWAATRGGRRWPVRLGYRTETLHTLDAGGREVREHFVTGGSGFGVGDGRGEIDWFLEYGRRGDAQESEFFEEIFRFGVTLTGAETWTRRRRPDDGDDW